MSMALPLLLAKSVSAATFDRLCAISAPGNACIFSVKAAAAGTISVSTRACIGGQRWRVTIARSNSSEVVSQIGTGSTTAFTGRAVRSTSTGTGFRVIVTIESPAPADFAGAMIVRFSGPFTTAGGPRPNGDPNGNSVLVSSSDGSPAQLPPLACDRDFARSLPVFVAPVLPQLPPTSTLLPPTTVFLSPTPTVGFGASGL
jgi:hypothetical protein